MSLVAVNPIILLSDAVASQGGTTVDAAGESAGIVGRVHLEGVTGSKTISAAGGGVIWILVGTTTFANAGSNFRVGLQDVDTTTGLEDATFDVYGDLTGGGGGLTANLYAPVTMTSGTKTVSHGDLIAIVAELTARGGADSIVVAASAAYLPLLSATGILHPYGTADTGTLAKSSNIPNFLIQFDDGTVGWIEGAPPSPRNAGAGVVTQTFNSGSTPDEYAALFSLTYKCVINAVLLQMGAVNTGDDFEVILYSDPTGTPVAERTVTADPDVVSGTAGSQRYVAQFAEFTLTANATYGIALRPTTTNNISYSYFDLGAGTGASTVKHGQPFGTTALVATRTNQSGAFSSLNARYWPSIGVWITQIDDGAGGGGTAFIIGG